MPRVAILLLVSIATVGFADEREWSDATGKYTLKAKMVARDDAMVVLEKGNKDLVGIRIEQLSKADQTHLKKLAEKQESNPEMQTWTTRRGLKIRGALVEYARRDVVIRRRRGNIYVNDKRFENLPGIYRKMLPQVVAYFEELPIETEKQFRDWARKLGTKTKRFTCEGVILELESGDLYAIPFFFFSDEDLKLLEPGWEAWSKTKEDDEIRQQHALSLRAQARADEQEQNEFKQMMVMNLQLQGYQAGLFSLWEVAMFPPAGAAGFPVTVVVPARNSQQAAEAAALRYPGYRVGPRVKLARK